MQNDSSSAAFGGAGANKKSTVYVAGLAPEVNEEQLLSAFMSFGDIIDIKIPHEQHEPNKHRGFAFLTFSHPSDAQDAIDNYDLNELPGYQGRGKILKCSLAQPSKFQNEGGKGFDRAVWNTEEWKQEHNKEDGDGDATGGEVDAVQEEA